MSDKKFEFTEQERERILAWFDDQRIGDIHEQTVLHRIEQLISSRSASPQQGVEEVLHILPFMRKNPNDTGLNKWFHYDHLIPAFEQFAASQVEQAVKELKEDIRLLTHQIDMNKSQRDEYEERAINNHAELWARKERIEELEHALKVQTEHVVELEKALNIIKFWILPETGLFWDDDPARPISYEAEHGSNGARAYMRNIAKEALKSK